MLSNKWNGERPVIPGDTVVAANGRVEFSVWDMQISLSAAEAQELASLIMAASEIA
jgi:hypothetical protein